MKRFPGTHGRVARCILKAKHSIETRVKAKRHGYGDSSIGREDREPLIPVYPGIKTAKEHEAKKQWRCPDFSVDNLAKTIEKDHARLHRVLRFSHPENRLIRPELEIVLEDSLKDAQERFKRKEKKNMHKRIASFLLDDPNTAGSDLISLVGERNIFSRVQIDEEHTRAIVTQVDYMLFHGEPDDLEASLVIMRARYVGELITADLLFSMARIHEARVEAGAQDTEIWGIATDCDEWTFACIDNKSRCSYHKLTWPRSQDQVLCRILQILKKAMDRAARVSSSHASQATAWRRMRKQKKSDDVHPTGVRIIDPNKRIYSRRDRFSGRFIDFEDVWW
ncbi:hypothetical protein BJX64DRAFT_283823 [Aspergillus heterothallicus]